MAHKLDKYATDLKIIRDANKAIIATEEPRAQKLISKIIRAHDVIVREIAAVERLIKVDSTADKK